MSRQAREEQKAARSRSTARSRSDGKSEGHSCAHLVLARLRLRLTFLSSRPLACSCSRRALLRWRTLGSCSQPYSDRSWERSASLGLSGKPIVESELRSEARAEAEP